MDEYIVIGIDFGTTYSGAAWACSSDPEEIEVVTSWESDLNHCSDLEKAPTQLYYDEGDEDEADEDVKWGYAIPKDGEALEWFKLLLLKDEDLPEDVRSSSQMNEARRLQEVSERDVIDIVACFLKNLWEHTLQSIADAVGEDLVSASRFHVVMTLPAIWPHYAQEHMRKAVEIAGISGRRLSGKTAVQFISEPEAAALATIKDLSKRKNVKVDDKIVVCDAGGGTVDLISYKVESKEPFVLKECVKGKGDLCGGIFVDQAFENLIKTKVCGSWGNIDKQQIKKFLNDNWEHGIKPQFRGQDRSWGVDLPAAVIAKGHGKKRPKTLELSTSELVGVFRPVVEKIEALVRFQTMSILVKYGIDPKFLILVGGFGRSPYLFERLTKLVGSETTVLQSRGSKPWVAICRGAVIHGLTSLGRSESLDIKVETRIARMSYGIKVFDYFNPALHSFRDKYWDDRITTWLARNQTSWFIRQGDDLSAATSIRLPFVRFFNGPVGQISEEFYVSASTKPPSRMDGSVSLLCSVNWDKTVTLDSLPRKKNRVGMIYHILHFEIEMTCNGQTIDFAVYYKGKRVAKHNVAVEYS